MGLAPDVGAPQLLGKMVGNDSLLRELIYTGRAFGSDEAEKLGRFMSSLSDIDDFSWLMKACEKIWGRRGCQAKERKSKL